MLIQILVKLMGFWGFGVIPSAFLQGNHMNSLILNNNKISSFGNTLNISVTASYLDLSSNNIAAVKFLIPSANYDHVDLSDNQLVSIETTTAITVREFNLSANQLREQSKFRFQKIDVTKLDLSHNKLSKADIEGLLDSHFLFDMQSLILSHNQIESLNKINLPKLNWFCGRGWLYNPLFQNLFSIGGYCGSVLALGYGIHSFAQ